MSDQDHHKHHRKHRIKKSLKMVLISSVSLLVVLAGFFVFLTFAKPTKSSDEIKQAGKDLIVKTDIDKAELVLTESSLGFSLSYDNEKFTVTGQTTDPSSDDKYVTGQSYEKEDLRVKREYSMIKFKSKVSEGPLYSHPEMVVLTNIRKDHLTAAMAKPENKGKTKLDVYEASVIERQIASKMKQVGQTQNVSISGIDYRLLEFTYDTESSYGLSASSVDRYYLTIQNDRAYQVVMYNVNDQSAREEIPAFETIQKTIRYQGLDASKLSFQPLATLVADLPSDSINTPKELKDETLFRVVAKNQPAVVRIGASRCANVSIQLPGEVADLGRLCGAGIGSGSFVSKDGYVATNGHVTRLPVSYLIGKYYLYDPDKNSFLDKVTKLLGYLEKLDVITASQKKAVIDGLNAGDSQAKSIVLSLGSKFPASSLVLDDDKSTYALQTGSKPMRIKSDLSGFDLNETVINAKYVDANYDEGTNLKGVSLYENKTGMSDVSILKANGNFPIINIGSISNLSQGDLITAIGFPAFVDGGLSTTRSKTVPTVTQGRVVSIDGDNQKYSGNKLIATTTQISGGNSGGPAIDKDGNMIGLNTYGSIKCSDAKCFGDGTARDIADYQALLAKNDIKLDTNSEISSEWQKGLDAFDKEDYGTAAKHFSKVEQLYPASYLAAELGRVARANSPSLFDISSDDMPRMIVAWSIGAVVLLAFISVIVLVIMLARHNRQERRASQIQPPMTPPSSQPPIQPYGF